MLRIFYSKVRYKTQILYQKADDYSRIIQKWQNREKETFITLIKPLYSGLIKSFIKNDERTHELNCNCSAELNQTPPNIFAANTCCPSST